MKRTLCRIWLGLFTFLVLPLASVAAAGETVHVGTQGEFVEALRQAQAGTTILVAPGKYQGGLSRSGLAGTKEAPIVIAGAEAANPPVIEGGAGGLHLSSPAHVELRDLVLAGARGNGLNIDDSGSSDTLAHDVLIRRVTVRDVGPEGNRDGMKLSGVKDFRLEACRIERWGSSGSGIDMVGCHHGVVRGCTFADATGDSANGVQTKGGSSEILIERCRFENCGGRGVNVGGRTGLAYFRPRNATAEATQITVQDCEFLGGMSAVCFVGVDGALVQHNTIYAPKRWPIRILQENTEARLVRCRNGRFVKNVVAFRAEEVRQVINIGGNTSPETFQFADNVWLCLDRPADTQRLVRLPVQETGGIYGIDPGFKDAKRGDLSIPNRKPDAGVRPVTKSAQRIHAEDG